MVNRHDSLRTHFSVMGDDIVQIIDDKTDFIVSYESQNSSDLDAIYTNFVKPFDLTKAPLFRA